MSMSEYNAIFKNDNGKNFRLKWNVARIAGNWHGFHLKEGMVYGISAFHPKGELRQNYAYVYTGETRIHDKTGCKYVRVFLRNEYDPESAYFQWKSTWLPVKKGAFTERLYWEKVQVKDYAEYFPDYSKPRNNQLSYQPQGGKSVGALFEYSGFGIKRRKTPKTAK